MGHFLVIFGLMIKDINPSWKNALALEFEKVYFQKLTNFVNDAYNNTTCYPEQEQIFSAFNHCDFDALKVVVLGQDPYHGKGQANGLCFSVKDEVKHPPSLINILKELNENYDSFYPATGNLEAWAKQGILLLNATLTVEEAKAGSHQKQGWEQFTDAVITQISAQKVDILFLLWGKFAEKKM